jgi:hypothetical protein
VDTTPASSFVLAPFAEEDEGDEANGEEFEGLRDLPEGLTYCPDGDMSRPRPRSHRGYLR